MKILLTGSSGFIGQHVKQQLAIHTNWTIIGIDKVPSRFTDIVEDLLNSTCIEEASPPFDCIIHLAGLSGVRDSDARGAPESYIDNNCKLTVRIFEQARKNGSPKILYASSSSVYGDTDIPFTESKVLPVPKSIYALSKQIVEEIGAYYWSRFQIPNLGLRFFTVYGPGSRKNMAPYLFTTAALEEKPVTIYNDGNQTRDFTHVYDVVRAIESGVRTQIQCDVVNIGSSSPLTVNRMLRVIESALQKNIQKHYANAHPADGANTFADTTKAKALLGFEPKEKFEPSMEKYCKYLQFKSTKDTSLLKKAFITAIFSTGTETKKIDTPGHFERVPGWDYILYTNLDFDQSSTSWTIQKLDIGSLTSAKSGIPRSRLPKFNCWKIPEFNYDIVVYLDGYLAPKKNEPFWTSVCKLLLGDCDMIVNKHPKNNSILEEIQNIQRSAKDSPARCAAYKEYFTKIGFPIADRIPLFQNTYFAYSPHNPLIQELFKKVWDFLEPNKVSHRDQPIFAYYAYYFKPVTIAWTSITNEAFGKVGKSLPHTYI